jgi:PDZ domain-containing secreted protein
MKQAHDWSVWIIYILVIVSMTVIVPFAVPWEYEQIQRQIVYVNGTVIHQTSGSFGVTTTYVQLDNGTIITFQGCNSDLYVGEYIHVPFLAGMNLLEQCGD